MRMTSVEAALPQWISSTKASARPSADPPAQAQRPIPHEQAPEPARQPVGPQAPQPPQRVEHERAAQGASQTPLAQPDPLSPPANVPPDSEAAQELAATVKLAMMHQSGAAFLAQAVQGDRTVLDVLG